MNYPTKSTVKPVKQYITLSDIRYIFNFKKLITQPIVYKVKNSIGYL